MDKISALKQDIINTLDLNKALDIVSIDLKDKSSMADYMIIASGTSSRHIQSLSEQVLNKLKDNGIIDSKIEGNNSRLKDLVTAQENLDQKIEKLYERYRTQYSYMESSIAALEETGNMLASAFAQKD